MIPPIARRFVAGESASESLDYVADLNRNGIGGILNLLGEHYETQDAADEDRNAYLDLISRLDKTELTASISVKPSQIGLEAGDDVFEDNLNQILKGADEKDVFVWIDMEDHTTTDVTLDAYSRFTSRYGGGVGLCVQANLKRTNQDLKRLAESLERFGWSKARTTNRRPSRTNRKNTSMKRTSEISSICFS